MQSYEELFDIAKRLKAAGSAADRTDITEPLNALQKAANELKRSFSGSWLGYHSHVYYAGLIPAPPGANFSQEWGLQELFGNLGSRGDWREFDPESVKSIIYQKAGDPDLTPAHKAAAEAAKAFDVSKSDIISVLENEIGDPPDKFLSRLKDDVDKLEPLSAHEVAQHWSPKGAIMTRDTLALGQGNRIPPHIEVLAEAASIQHTFGICNAAADISTKSASHLERRSRSKYAAKRLGTNVFIGHGRSKLWRELKDFVQDRLGLPWDEFNRVPVAGVTNIARLSEMLDAAAVGFLILTAEDEMADGQLQARMNVVHEAGLFQGRLGFTKAILLLEEGCTEFTNIEGLGQIRFPKGNIAASFEEVRRVLEREGLLGD